MTTAIKRILALFAAVWMLSAPLALPAAAKQVNQTEDPEKLYDVQYGEDYYEAIGNIESENEFWSTQPFDSYWSDSGTSLFKEPRYDRKRSWAIINSYYAGKGALNQKALNGVIGYLGLETIMTCAVFTDEENWNLVKQSDTTSGTLAEVIYVGEVMSGDTIFIQANSYAAGTYYAQYKRNKTYTPQNDPAYLEEWREEPNEYWAFYTNIRAVQKNGEWAPDAEDYVIENQSRDAYCSGWLYTVNEGDEVIYADAIAKVNFSNEYTGYHDNITIRYRFKFVVMDSGADVTLPINTQQTEPQDTNPGSQNPDPGQTGEEDGDNWWEGLFDDDKEDTESTEVTPPEPSKPETKPEGERLTEKEAAVIGTVGGAAVIGAAVGAMAGGGGPEVSGPDPDAELKREEERLRQEELKKQEEAERARQKELERLKKEYADQQRQMKEYEEQLKQEAKKKAEEHKRYVDRLYKKYGVDPNQENASKILRNTIKKEQIKNEQEAAAELAKDAEYAVYEQLATDLSNWADISLELCASVTGETGQGVLAAYYTLKGTASRTAEAIARIAYNGKSYKDYGIGDYAKDAWDLTHSAVQGTAEGFVKAGQAVTSYNDATAKAKLALQVGGEAAKEMWDTARAGGDFVDVLKAGARGTTKGAVNATISYALDKTVGKLAGKGKTVANTTLNNYPGQIANKITSGDLWSGGSNTTVSLFTNKIGLDDKIDGLFGGKTAHADAAAKAAKKVSDAAKGMK